MMYRVLQPFEFFEPASVKEVSKIVDNEKAMVLAGGVDLVLKMRRREIVPEKVVSLQKVPGLDFIKKTETSGLAFGALATLKQIEESPIVNEKWPILSEAISKIVSVQTKVMGTAVGNLCVGTPASDVAPALIAMGAIVKAIGTHSEREISMEDFFMDVGKTALNPHEIVTEVCVPELPPNSYGAFGKLSKTAEDIAKVNVAVMVTFEGEKAEDVRIALGAVAPTPIRIDKAEEALRGKVVDDKSITAASDFASRAAMPIDDIRSTAEYRREMVRILVRDALKKTAEKAQA